ncbi:Uncharacterized protein FWK35_00022910 [Aphis craccivora]|uniref:Uncharacterized protein n=1 Tax=Aphis craccivora TaxID=307492 RepID=A0A6G0ZHE9_APHCR|nr:Uncharacterized protein FWK35_00022910 [Aphis craccivora]
MTLSICENNNDDVDDNDYEEHDKTRPIRRHNITTVPKISEMNSEDSLFNYMANRGRKSLLCAETGPTKRFRNCTKATCLRPNKGNRHCGNADAVAASLCCNNPVQKTSRPAPSPHDRRSACNKTSVAECRCQCVTRTGNYGANDNVQCTSTAETYRVTDGQCTSTGNCGPDKGSCNNDTATLISKVSGWARAAADWTLDKTTNILLFTVAFLQGLYLCDYLGLCGCECSCKT